MLQEFVPTEKLRRKSKSLINARTRGTSSRGQGVGSLAVPGFISWFDRQTQRKPSYFPTYSPVLKPGQEKIASRTALDLQQFQTLFTVFKLRLNVDFPWG